MALRNQNENLFEDSRMSFGEHLEELRKVLIRSLIGVAVGCLIGFLVAEQVVEFLQRPLENALTKYYVQQGKSELKEENGYLAPELSRWLDIEEKVPETVLIDPGQLVTALRSVSPDFLRNVVLKPYQFRFQQFSGKAVASLCRDWSEFQTDDEIQAKQWKFLWDSINDGEQQVIARIGGKAEASESEIQSFVAILNGLLGRREISDAAEFEPIINQTNKSFSDLLTPEKENPLIEMRERLQREFDPDLSERLNRLIVSEAFGERVGEMKLDMLPLTIWKSARFQSQSLGATETFMIWVKAGVVAGLVLSSPWVFFQLWTFVAAGLYPAEQRYIYVFLPISLALFFSGVFLAFFFVFEPVLDFLFSFNARMKISPQPRINDWLSFVLFLPLGFGIAFQLPLVMLFVNRIELISVEAYTGNWRVAVVAIFGISMLLTPADPVSMIMLATPLTGLYFLGIFLCRWLNKPSNPFQQE